MWSTTLESNQGPQSYQDCALPTELVVVSFIFATPSYSVAQLISPIQIYGGESRIRTYGTLASTAA